ncbi:MAG: CoA-binding protein [Terriglobia bacterium]
MREASLSDITKFLECKRIAFVGVSRDTKHFSRLLMSEFLANGYDTVPVNPQAKEIDGRQCFTRVADVTPAVEAALLMTAVPEATDQAVRECHQVQVANIWIYKSLKDGADHEREVDLCRQRGSTVVEGYCPLMFLPHPQLVHRLHRMLMKVVGGYPL